MHAPISRHGAPLDFTVKQIISIDNEPVRLALSPLSRAWTNLDGGRWIRDVTMKQLIQWRSVVGIITGPGPPLPRGKFTKYTYLSTNCSTNRPASLIILAFSMPYTLIWPLLIFDSRSATELIGNDVRPGRSGRWAMDPGCSGFLDFFHGGGGQCTWITLKQTVRIVLNWEVLRG